MDFMSGVIFVGIRLAVLFFFGIAVWRLESHPRQNKRPSGKARAFHNPLVQYVA